MKRFTLYVVFLMFGAGVADFAAAQQVAMSGNYSYFNFKSLQMETIPELPSTEKMREFIPQTLEAQSLYNLQIQVGKSPMEATTAVLEEEIAALKVLPPKNVKGDNRRPAPLGKTTAISGQR